LPPLSQLVWLRASSFLDDLVLQTAGRGLDAFFLFVLGEEFFTIFYILLAKGLLFIFNFFLSRLHSFFNLIFIEQRLFSAQGILYAGKESVGIEFQILFLEIEPRSSPML